MGEASTLTFPRVDSYKLATPGQAATILSQAQTRSTAGLCLHQPYAPTLSLRQGTVKHASIAQYSVLTTEPRLYRWLSLQLPC